MTKQVSFDRPTRDRLREAYDAAVAAGVKTFVFEGNEYFVGYAKYLLEFLDQALGK